jgi:tetratricopeptide (TPR) repeat protein
MHTIAARLDAALAGRYVLDRLLGEGGMGSVFLATDLRHERQVAIKVLRADVGTSMGAERFLQEIRIAARLEHPHILMLIDSGETDGLLYYVMPFVEGESLRDRLHREGPLPLGDALRIAAQVADALDYAHARGIIHRDIKPENILLSDGHAKVADFGIARLAGAPSGNLTQTGMSLGTPSYMSPEQIMGERELDGRSDLYSLACVLYEMLAGAPPFTGTSAQAVMVKRMTQDAERIRAKREQVPVLVDMVLARALARDAAERQASTREFAAALLSEISGTSAVAVPQATGNEIVPERRTPLVGREAELDEARGMLARLAKGQGGVLLIGGEPGVGKTRLSQAILDEARAAGALCLVGRCYEMEGTPPYTPYAELLDTALRLIPPQTFRGALGDAAPEIARVLPSLRQAFSDIGEPLDLPPDKQRQHLYNKYREFNERAARITPIVVLLDDLHWADDASLGLLAHSATYLDTLPIIAIGTYRDVDLDVNRGFATVLESLLRQRQARRIALRRLPADGVASLLAALGGAEPPAALVRAIHAETDGNPFFVEEVFQHLREEGKLFDADGVWRTDVRVDELDVPEGVRLVIGRRLARLSETCRTVLTSAAVFGPRFPLTVLEALGEVPEDALLDALDEAVRAQLIAEQRGGREVLYAFSHELIRQTLLGGLSMPRRQRRHLKVAQAIEKVLGARVEQRPSDLAYHLYQAGAASDPDKTMYFLTLAAEQANAAAAYREAHEQGERARSLEEVTDKSAWARLHCARGVALKGLARWKDAFEALQAAFDAALESGDPQLLAESALPLGWLHAWTGHFDRSADVAERALARMPDVPTADRLRLEANAAVAMASARFDFQGAEVRFERALACAVQLGNQPLVGALLAMRATLHFQFGRFFDVVRFAEAAKPMLEAPVHRQDYLESAGHRMSALLYAGLFDKGRAAAATLSAIAAESGNVGTRINLDAFHCGAELFASGRIADASAFAAACHRTWAEAGPWAHLMAFNPAMEGLLRGEIERSIRNVQDARAAFPFTIWGGFLEGVELTLVAWGDPSRWDTTYAMCRRLYDSRRAEPTLGERMLGLQMACALHVRGERPTLAALYGDLLAYRTNGLVLLGMNVTDVALALAAAAAGDRPLAEQHMHDAMTFLDTIDHRVARPCSQLLHADLLLAWDAEGDRARARTLLEQAANGFSQIGATFFVGLASERLAHL